MKPRGMTRPVKIVTLGPSIGAPGGTAPSELVPLTERWRPVWERIRRDGRTLVIFAGALWGGLHSGWSWSRRILVDGVRRIGPIAATAGTRLGAFSRTIGRATARGFRAVRRRVRRSRRRRGPAISRRAQGHLLRSLDRLAWEVRRLQAQIQTQQDLLARLAFDRSDQGTDIAWAARVIASTHRLSGRPLALTPRDETPGEGTALSSLGDRASRT